MMALFIVVDNPTILYLPFLFLAILHICFVSRTVYLFSLRLVCPGQIHHIHCIFLLVVGPPTPLLLDYCNTGMYVTLCTMSMLEGIHCLAARRRSELGVIFLTCQKESSLLFVHCLDTFCIDTGFLHP